MKEFVVKSCRRCGSQWYGDSKSVTLLPGDQLTVVQVKISFCTICQEAYDQEIEAPRYQRVPRKK